MSRENVEIVQRWVEFYNRRDTDGLISLNTPDYEMKSVFADIEQGESFAGTPVSRSPTSKRLTTRTSSSGSMRRTSLTQERRL